MRFTDFRRHQLGAVQQNRLLSGRMLNLSLNRKISNIFQRKQLHETKMLKKKTSLLKV